MHPDSSQGCISIIWQIKKYINKKKIERKNRKLEEERNKEKKKEKMKKEREKVLYKTGDQPET